jgi:hypothetical protein
MSLNQLERVASWLRSRYYNSRKFCEPPRQQRPRLDEPYNPEIDSATDLGNGSSQLPLNVVTTYHANAPSIQSQQAPKSGKAPVGFYSLPIELRWQIYDLIAEVPPSSKYVCHKEDGVWKYRSIFLLSLLRIRCTQAFNLAIEYCERTYPTQITIELRPRELLKYQIVCLEDAPLLTDSAAMQSYRQMCIDGTIVRGAENRSRFLRSVRRTLTEGIAVVQHVWLPNPRERHVPGWYNPEADPPMTEDGDLAGLKQLHLDIVGYEAPRDLQKQKEWQEAQFQQWQTHRWDQAQWEKWQRWQQDRKRKVEDEEVTRGITAAENGIKKLFPSVKKARITFVDHPWRRVDRDLSEEMIRRSLVLAPFFRDGRFGGLETEVEVRFDF